MQPLPDFGGRTKLLSTFLVKMEEKGAYLVRIYPVVLGEGIISLPSTRIIIGRDPECDIALADQDVSRQHASIEFLADGYTIIDLGSTNGTLVNDKKMGLTILHSGDRIRIGTTLFRFLRGNDIEAQYHETVYSMMINDGLTGIRNKRYIQDALGRELFRSQRHKRPLSIAVLDIDHFKAVNDKYGHLAGDVVLRELAKRINKAVRSDEVFARYGGEEFVVLLPESSLDQAKQFGERVRLLAAEAPIAIEGTKIPVTISVGVGHTSGNEDITTEDLFALADKKLYEAKNSGRNCVMS